MLAVELIFRNKWEARGNLHENEIPAQFAAIDMVA
jgi:hypothetical protein